MQTLLCQYDEIEKREHKTQARLEAAIKTWLIDEAKNTHPLSQEYKEFFAMIADEKEKKESQRIDMQWRSMLNELIAWHKTNACS